MRIFKEADRVVWIGDRNDLFLSHSRRITIFDAGHEESAFRFLLFPSYFILNQLAGYRDDFKDILLQQLTHWL